MVGAEVAGPRWASVLEEVRQLVLGKAHSFETIFQKIFYVAIRFHPSGRPWCVRNRRRYAMSDQSEWETPAAVEAMRSDPRMKAYFPMIIELASLDSIVGSAVLSETR
jgi:hypothetical protein